MSDNQVIFNCTEVSGDFIEIGNEAGTTGKCTVISIDDSVGVSTVYLSNDDTKKLADALLSQLEKDDE